MLIVFICTQFMSLTQAAKLALFTGLEHFLEELPSLICQTRRQLYSDNIKILEHFGRRLQDAFDVMNIFKNSNENVLAPRELTNFIYNVISETEMLLNRIENFLSTDREYVVQLLKTSQVRRDETVDKHPGDL